MFWLCQHSFITHGGLPLYVVSRVESSLVQQRVGSSSSLTTRNCWLIRNWRNPTAKGNLEAFYCTVAHVTQSAVEQLRSSYIKRVLGGSSNCWQWFGFEQLSPCQSPSYGILVKRDFKSLDKALGDLTSSFKLLRRNASSVWWWNMNAILKSELEFMENC